jgi:beta-galactosidase
VEFSLAAATSWAPAGHVVARDQLPLSPAPARLSFCACTDTVPAGAVQLRPRFGADGFLSSLAVGGAELLSSPLRPCLFRAPTQNDGLKNFMSYRGKPDFSFYYTGKAMYGWLDAGLEELSSELVSRTGSCESGGFSSSHRLRGSRAPTSASSSSAGLWLRTGPWKRISPSTLSRDSASCLGWGSSARCLRGWTGRAGSASGPRRPTPTAAPAPGWAAGRRTRLPPGSLHRPQENGNRHGVRWAEFRGAGSALAVSGGAAGAAPFDFSLSAYTDAELWEARHWDRLPAFGAALSRGAVLHLDAVQRGVGTATCGPDTLERYRIRSGVHRLSLRFGSALS